MKRKGQEIWEIFVDKVGVKPSALSWAGDGEGNNLDKVQYGQPYAPSLCAKSPCGNIQNLQYN